VADALTQRGKDLAENMLSLRRSIRFSAMVVQLFHPSYVGNNGRRGAVHVREE